MIGAGGLGSPVLQYLAAAGVGTIGIVDDDVVDLSNLQRQVVHRTASVGEPKTASAARALYELDPHVEVVEHRVRLTAENALELVAVYDLVVDGSDNFATRYLANDACAMLLTPYVWGSVLRYDGEVAVFWEGAPDGRSVDYRDLHPVPPSPGEVLSCSEAGVLGALCGQVGSMMAIEVVKLITGVGDPLLGRVQVIDALAGDMRGLRVVRAPGREPVQGLVDYDAFCGVVPEPAVPERLVTPEQTVTPEQLEAAASGSLIDVREPHEFAVAHLAGARLVPLGRIDEVTDGPVTVYCASGVRSARAVAALRARGVVAVSLAGGIDRWIVEGRHVLRS